MKIATLENLNNIHFEWLIDEFLPKQSLTMIYAEAGSGKSYLALYLAKSLLEQGKVKEVIYLDGDTNEQLLKERGGKEFIKLSHFNYIYANNKSKYSIFKDLEYSCDLENSLIIIDSIRNFINIDFTKDNLMSMFFDALQKLRDKGATIIFLHHQPKQLQDENNKLYKGSTAFMDSSDEGYFLYNKIIKENEEYILLLEPQKQRFKTKPQAFKINALNLSLEKVPYLKYAETQKAQITLSLIQENLSEFKENGLSQQDLANKVKSRVEKDYIEIVGRNALWSLLDKYKGVYFNISYEAKENGGKKKIIKLL